MTFEQMIVAVALVGMFALWMVEAARSRWYRFRVRILEAEVVRNNEAVAKAFDAVERANRAVGKSRHANRRRGPSEWPEVIEETK